MFIRMRIFSSLTARSLCPPPGHSAPPPDPTPHRSECVCVSCGDGGKLVYCSTCIACVCVECISKVESKTRAAYLMSDAKRPFHCYRCAPGALGRYQVGGGGKGGGPGSLGGLGAAK